MHKLRKTVSFLAVILMMFQFVNMPNFDLPKHVQAAEFESEPAKLSEVYEEENNFLNEDPAAPELTGESSEAENDETGSMTTTSLLNIPANITSASTNTTITLDWDAVTGATSYDIDADGTIISGITETTFTHHGLTPDTSYAYKIRASDGLGTSEWSDAVTQSTLVPIAANITIDGDTSDWDNIVPIAQGSDSTISLSAVQDQDKLYMLIKGTDIGDYNDFYIDSDNDSTTGRHNTNWPNCGADYLIEDDGLYQRVDDEWIDAGIVNISRSSTVVEVTVNFSQIGRSGPGEMRLSYDRNDANCAPPMGSLTAMADMIISSTSSSLTAPANIIISPTYTTMTLGWDAVSGATSYDIYADGTIISGITETEYTHHGLTPDTTYTYKIRASNGSETSDWSDAVTQSTLAPIAADITVDGDASDWNGISPITQGSGSIISLSAVQDQDKLYMLIKGTNIEYPDDFYIDSDNDSTTGRHNTNWPNCGADYMVEDGWLYKWVDNSWADAGTVDISRNSAIVEVSVDFSQIGRTGPGEMRLSYDRMDENCTPPMGSLTAMADMIISSTSSSLTAPANIIISPTYTTMTLGWDAVSGATSYDIYADGTIISGITETEYTHHGLTPDTTYTYKIRASNGSETSDWSDAVTQSTLAPIAADITVDGDISDWDNIAPIAEGSGSTISLSAVQDQDKLYMLIKGTDIGDYNDFYIDSDNDSTTGRHNTNWPNCGADYLIEDDGLYQWVNDEWVDAGTVNIFRSSMVIEVSVDFSQIGRTGPGEIRLSYDRDDANCAPQMGSSTAMDDMMITKTHTSSMNIIYEYDSVLQRIIYLNIDGVRKIQYFYDNNGNLIRKEKIQ